jgi:hypothetical protein
MLLLFKTNLQIIFCKAIQEHLRLWLDFVDQHKIFSFEKEFEIWKKEDVAGSMIRRIREVSKHSDVSTGQNPAVHTKRYGMVRCPEENSTSFSTIQAVSFSIVHVDLGKISI